MSYFCLLVVRSCVRIMTDLKTPPDTCSYLAMIMAKPSHNLVHKGGHNSSSKAVLVMLRWTLILLPSLQSYCPQQSQAAALKFIGCPWVDLSVVEISTPLALPAFTIALAWPRPWAGRSRHCPLLPMQPQCSAAVSRALEGAAQPQQSTTGNHHWVRANSHSKREGWNTHPGSHDRCGECSALGRVYPCCLSVQDVSGGRFQTT